MTKSREQWLAFAPPPPRIEGDAYDVFISYRSTDRAWALALYDALASSGWNPFLDQFELIPGEPLTKSLEEALQASSSGVILWSRNTKNSDWCEKERDAMDVLQADKPEFRYVYAKLDDTKLPMFARRSLYVDFNGTSGPQGMGLLQIMYGLAGQKPDPRAVRFSQDLSDLETRASTKIEAAVEAGNVAGLLAIALSDEVSRLVTTDVITKAAQALIGMKAFAEAAQVVARGLELFPGAIRPRQIQGLILRRQGEFAEAIEVLAGLTASGHKDPETLGILAAAWDGLYQASKHTLYLRKSTRYYVAAFAGNPKSYYAGINAAAKSLFLGDHEKAQTYAEQVLSLVKDDADGSDMWRSGSLAEAKLILGEIDDSLRAYRAVVERHFNRPGDLGSMKTQAVRICKALGLPPEQTRAVEGCFTDLPR